VPLPEPLGPSMVMIAGATVRLVLRSKVAEALSTDVPQKA
jgi:hypothetical protein